MKVWVVLAYDQYYPSGDNIRGIFTTELSARRFSEEVYKNGWGFVEVVSKEVKYENG